MNQLIIVALVAGVFLIALSILNSYKDEKIISKNYNCVSCGKKLLKEKDNTVLFDGVICPSCAKIALKTNALTPQAKSIGKRGFKFTKSDLVKSEIELFKKLNKGNLINDEDKENSK